jgi:tetratricopeptide (TPR) repeat protein
MSHVRYFAINFLVIAWVGTPCAVAQAPVGGASPTAIWLSADARTVPVGQKLHGGLLTRELVRQAVLMAAREELGLATRDEGLSDPMPENASGGTVSLRIHVVTPRPNRFRIELSSIDTTPEKRLLARAFDVDPDPVRLYASLLVILERESRAALLDTLKQAGLTDRRSKPGGRTPDTTRIDELLANMDFVSQFTAVRLAHAQIREQGQSPELLARIVRGYAHLAMLTQHFWNATGDVFAARSLVYAERFYVASNRSPLALAHRAYAKALCGAHAAALADLAELQKSSASASGDAADVPKWLTLIDAYCHFDRDKVQAEAEGDAAMLQLSKLLVARVNDALGNWSQLMGQIDSAVEESPEAYGLFPPLWEATSIYIPRRQAAATTMENFGRLLPARIRQTVEIPQTVRDLAPVPAANGSGDDVEFVRNRSLTALFPETPTKIAEALTQAVDVDPMGEPSWRALAGMIREEAFDHVAINTFAHSPTVLNAEGNPVRHFIAGHRYEAHIRGYAVDRNAQSEDFKRIVGGLRFSDPNPSMWRFFSRMWLVEAGARYSGSRAMYDAFEQRDFTCEYLMACIRHAEIMIPENKTVDAMYNGMLTHMQSVSPFCPVAVRAAMEQVKAPSSEQLAAWEKSSANDPRASRSLGFRYREMGRYNDAIRVLEQAIKLSPDGGSFVDLADTYRLSGKPDLWKPTLERYLAIVGKGWEGGRVRNRIAQYHIERGEWKLAEPYAIDAASAGEEATAITASEVYEGLENWAKSEEHIRGVSMEARDKEKMSWYFWCRRTGRGDLDAARQLARQYMAAPLANDIYAPESFGVLELLEGDRANALIQFDKAWGLRRESEWCGLHVVLLVAEDKDQQALDQALVKLLNQTKADDPATPAEVRDPVRLVVDQMAGGGGAAVNGDALMAALDRMNREGRAKFGYFFGRIAELAGEKTAAEKCYRRSLDGGLFRQYNATLAGWRLAQMQGGTR